MKMGKMETDDRLNAKANSSYERPWVKFQALNNPSIFHPFIFHLFIHSFSPSFHPSTILSPSLPPSFPFTHRHIYPPTTNLFHPTGKGRYMCKLKVILGHYEHRYGVTPPSITIQGCYSTVWGLYHRSIDGRNYNRILHIGCTQIYQGTCSNKDHEYYA